MKLGFFTDHPVNTSETFIHELLVRLEQALGSANLFHVVGNRNGQQVVENTYFGKFSVRRKWLKVLGQGEKALSLELHSSFRVRRAAAERVMKQFKKKDLPDVAYFEFGQPAVLFRRFMEEHNIPMVVHFHGMDASSAFNSVSYAQEIKRVFDYSTCIITASHHIKRLLVLKGCPIEKIRVVRLGVKVAEIKPLPREQRTTKPSVIFLGRLTEKKNPIALIYAFSLVKKTVSDAQLTIVGDGPLLKEVQDLLVKLDLSDSVTLKGAMPNASALELLSKHWIYAQHSVTASNGDQEGFAISPAEAAAYELPVVSTLHNGIPEHVIDGVTGYLVREFDFESMAERMIQLLQNPDLSLKLGQNGRKNILGLNDPEKRIESILGILQLAYQSDKAE